MKKITFLLASLLVLLSTKKSFSQCVSDTNSLVVNQNTTWSTNQVMTTDVFINAGVTLTITGTIEMYQHGNIYVDRAATLIIDGGTVTRASCTESWGGIQVYGTTWEPQTSTFQGRIILKNDAVLSYANTAINNSGYKCGFLWDKMGGMISATNSFFYNNLRDVQFGAYSYTNGGVTADYEAQFVTCEFKKDVLYPFLSSMPNVSMWGVYGVKFRGCDFVYEDTSVFVNKVSMAIVANDATLTITKNNEKPSTFTGHERAVFCIDAQRADKATVIEHSEFYPKGIAVAMVACSNFEITDNYIERKNTNSYQRTPNPNPNPVGMAAGDIYIVSAVVDACSNFEIRNNDFYALPHQLNANCLSITNCYMGVNSIYKNKLSNCFLFYSGVYAFGKNQSANGNEGLFLKCNEFSNNSYDIWVTAVENWHKPASQRGIPEFQGTWDPITLDKKDLGNNLFSLSSNPPAPLSPGKSVDFFVENSPAINISTNYVRYTHADNIPEFTPLANPTTGYGNMGLNTIGNLTVDYEDACPSPPLAGSVTIDEERAALSDYDEEYVQVSNTVSATLDGGYTEELESEILSTLPQNYTDLYLDLMEMAPFVSVRNLLNVISLPGFSKSQLKNLLIANPHGYRASAVKEALFALEDSFNETELAEIAETQVLMTAYDELKAELASLSQKRAAVIRNIVRENNINPSSEFDLQAFLLERNEASYHYSVVDELIAKGDLDDANTVLDQIEYLSSMDEDALTELESMKEYYNIVFGAFADNRKLDSLNDGEEAAALDLYLEGNYIASKKALGLLLLNNDDYGYMGFITPELSYKTIPSEKASPSSNKVSWSLFPNPSKDYVVMRWNEEMPQTTLLNIEVFNMAGNSILQESISSNLYTHVLHTKNWTEGIYIVRVTSAQGVHTTQKLLVQH